MDINIRDYILQEANPNGSSPTKATTYEVIFNSGPDFIVRRKSTKTSKLFVCLMSQEQFYFKNEKNADIIPFSKEGLANFISDCTDTLHIGNAWCNAIKKGIANAEEFVKFISNPRFIDLAKQGLVKIDFVERLALSNSYSEKSIETGIKVLSGIYSKEEIAVAVGSVYNYRTNRIAGYLTKYAAELFEELGIDNSRKYVQKRESLPQLEHMSIPQYTKLFFPEASWNSKGNTHRIFDPSKFIEYALQECVHQGYAQDETTFINEWADVLSMQQQLYGKVKEKYPESIPATHQIYSYHIRLHKQKVDEAKFAEQVNRLKAYEWRNKEYIIKCPENKDEIIDESIQQANCLAGYLQSFTEGKSNLFFLRKLKNPQKSLVTIEIQNGHLTQAYRARNKPISYEERTVVHKWCEAMGFSYA